MTLVAYLALLAPAVGLIPSGLQATADRYTYLPGVVLAIAAATAGAHWARRSARREWMVGIVAGLLITASALAARQTLSPWSDSIALWSRVVALNPAHDVGLYNLGQALAASGRTDEAAARYREVLALAPGHTAACAISTGWTLYASSGTVMPRPRAAISRGRRKATGAR